MCYLLGGNCSLGNFYKWKHFEDRSCVVGLVTWGTLDVDSCSACPVLNSSPRSSLLPPPHSNSPGALSPLPQQGPDLLEPQPTEPSPRPGADPSPPAARVTPDPVSWMVGPWGILVGLAVGWGLGRGCGQGWRCFPGLRVGLPQPGPFVTRAEAWAIPSLPQG